MCGHFLPSTAKRQPTTHPPPSTKILTPHGASPILICHQRPLQWHCTFHVIRNFGVAVNRVDLCYNCCLWLHHEHNGKEAMEAGARLDDFVCLVCLLARADEWFGFSWLHCNISSRTKPSTSTSDTKLSTKLREKKKTQRNQQQNPAMTTLYLLSLLN